MPGGCGRCRTGCMRGMIAGVQGGTEVVRRQARDAARRRGAAGGALDPGLDRGADHRRRQAALVGLAAGQGLLSRTGSGLVADVAAGGGRMLVYINPFLSRRAGARRALSSRRGRRATWSSGRTGRRSSIRNTTFDAAMIDLSNPAARAWIKGVIKDALIGEAGRFGVDERLRRGADVRREALRRRRSDGLAQPLSGGMGAGQPGGDRGGGAGGGHHLLRPVGLHPEPGDRDAVLARRPDAELGRVRRDQDRGGGAAVGRACRGSACSTATPAATWC